MKYQLLIIFSMVAFLSYGQKFPSMDTENTDGSVFSLPDELEGSKSILFLALTSSAEDMLSKWYEPIYIMFIDKSGINAMAFDCHVYLVMMFTGASQSGAEKVKENIRKNVDPEMAEHLLFYSGSMSDELKELGVHKKNDAHVLVLDEKGNVIASETGEYSERKLDKIAELVEIQ
ncbi:MAG: hypothetical protein R2813_11655 [Flavobacteriales bacterium]